MDWQLVMAIGGLIVPSCSLGDWLVSKEEEGREKCVIITWFVYLHDFKYAQAIQQANIYCNKLFDKVYGKKHFSWRCFCISCYVSVLSVLILTIIFLSLGILNLPQDKGRLFDILILVLLANIWIDYLSLIETRLVLKYSSQVKPIMLPLLLLADLFLCALIYLLFTECVGGALSWLEPVGETPVPDKSYLLRLLDVAFVWSHANADANIVFYSTFSTSFFFHVYCLLMILFKLIKLSKTRLMIVLDKLEKSNHLLKTLGGLIMVVIVFVKAASVLLAQR